MPSVRRRLVIANSRSNFRGLGLWGMAVSRLTTTSGSNSDTAVVSASRSSASAMTTWPLRTSTGERCTSAIVS